MTREEKLKLYEEAKEAYYNNQEIMSDLEFDNLEKELGLENKSYVGTRHNPSYTVKHPFVMGSLSKVQIHEKDGKIDWETYLKDVRKYIGDNKVIITPKYDGCSFEIYCNIDYNEIAISSRGDGNWGRDIHDHIIDKIPGELFNQDCSEFVLRGEVLVKKSIFAEKYAEQFTNPRSFVAGVLASDYSDSWEFNDKLNDLSVVIYDFRTCKNSVWKDHDWTDINHIAPELFPEYYLDTVDITWADNFADIYYQFDSHRKLSEYALDGFVIKPVAGSRINNMTEPRPKDCVAIKFIPMLEETEVINITWNLGKTGEYIPIIWVNPVEMDGRMVQKCSGHNYGLLVQKGVGIGSKIIMSLAGDIIPFLYKVTETHIPVNIPMPKNATVDGIHLMANLSEKEIARNSFVNSAGALNIPQIGNATANAIFDYATEQDSEADEFFGEDTPKKEIPTNILEMRPEQIYFGAGAGKAGSNAQKEFKKVLENLTLKDIIQSFNFKFCGKKVTEQVVNYLLGLDYNFASMASVGYEWCMRTDSDEMQKINNLLKRLGKNIDDFKAHTIAESNNNANQIPVILTGNPNNYKSKGEFMNHHPEYRITGSWKEVQIVFTNDLESNTGKMKKARQNNIEIRLY